jgi:hypothetical protein
MTFACLRRACVVGFAVTLAIDSSAFAQSSPAGGGAQSGTLQPEHPLKPAIRIAQSSLEALEGVRDYECLFTKRELIDGQMTSQMMQMRFREQPFSVYYKFGPPFAGREVLYVAGRNNGMMLAHEGSGVKSLVGSVSLALDCPKAKSENRHPLTEGGMRNIVALLVKQWEHESAYGEIEVQFYPSARVGDVECRVIEASHPRPRRQFLYHVTRLYLDSDTNYPVRLENYGWPAAASVNPPLIEEYTFLNVRTNLGFTDREFDPSNPEYSF